MYREYGHPKHLVTLVLHYLFDFRYKQATTFPFSVVSEVLSINPRGGSIVIVAASALKPLP
jgi:hypothetical protein